VASSNEGKGAGVAAEDGAEGPAANARGASKPMTAPKATMAALKTKPDANFIRNSPGASGSTARIDQIQTQHHSRFAAESSKRLDAGAAFAAA
jgi:hypothetical protein